MYNTTETPPFHLLKPALLPMVPVAPTGAGSFCGQRRLDEPAVVPCRLTKRAPKFSSSAGDKIQHSVCTFLSLHLFCAIPNGRRENISWRVSNRCI